LQERPSPDQLRYAFDAICDAFQIGSAARSLNVVMANIENVQRREKCLSAIEREFFTVATPPDPDEGDDEPGEECVLRWGAEPADYVEQFRAALAARASTPVGWIPVSERLPKVGETVLCFFAPMKGEKVSGANFATATMSAPHHWHNPEDDEDDYTIPALWQRIAAPSATPESQL
jgi:hypothetical protein